MTAYRVIPYLGLAPEDLGYLLRLADRHRGVEDPFTSQNALKNLSGPTFLGFLMAVRPHRAHLLEMLRSRALKDAILNSYLSFWILAILMEILNYDSLLDMFAYTTRQTKVRAFEKLKDLSFQIKIDTLLEGYLK